MWKTLLICLLTGTGPSAWACKRQRQYAFDVFPIIVQGPPLLLMDPLGRWKSSSWRYVHLCQAFSLQGNLMQQSSIMFPSHPNSPLSFSGLLLVICLRCLAQPVKSAAISFNSTLNAVSNSTALNHALGINCRGSSLCPTQDLSLDYIDFLLLLVNGRTTCEPDSTFDCGPLNDTDIYKPYAHIACLPQGKSFLGGICAFTRT